MIHSKKRLILNNSDAATRRNIREWFEYYTRDNFQTYVIFVQGNGTNSEGAAVVTKNSYVGHITKLSPWFRSNLNSASGIPAYIPLNFSITAEGSYTDFDVLGSATERAGHP